MFSSRLRQAAGRNRLAVALDRRRAAGLPIIDLTLSNPTRAGFCVSERAARADGADAGALLRARALRTAVCTASRLR